MQSGTKKVRLALKMLTPHPKNPNVHPISQLDALVASIKQFGQPRPILVRAANKMIIGGHGVYEALRRSGADEADVLLWDVDQETADRFMVADNRLGEMSRRDDDLIRDLLKDMPAELLPAIGYSQDDVDKLFTDHEDPELLIKAVETEDVLDTFWITIRGPLGQQAFALKRLRELMADLPGVGVELGTTPG